MSDLALKLCEKHLAGVRFHFSASPSLNVSSEGAIATTSVNTLEWNNFHFIDATSVQAELSLMRLSEEHFLSQDFLLTAAKTLTERACQTVISGGVLVVKQASFSSFHRLFPLPIKVEAKFQLSDDNKRSLKCLTRFYQGYTCTAEVNLSFDLYSRSEADDFYRELAEKTIENFSRKVEEDG